MDENNSLNNTAAPSASAQAANDAAIPAPRFDLGALRLPQNFATESEVEPVLATVEIRKPKSQEFVRVHPTLGETLCTLEVQAERKRYAVVPALKAALGDDVRLTRLVLAVTRQGLAFVWPLMLPNSDGRSNPWHASALQAAKFAESSWIKVRSDLAAGCYRVDRARAELGEPVWPKESFAEILKLAFGDDAITGFDHPVLKRLRGEL